MTKVPLEHIKTTTKPWRFLMIASCMLHSNTYYSVFIYNCNNYSKLTIHSTVNESYISYDYKSKMMSKKLEEVELKRAEIFKRYNIFGCFVFWSLYASIWIVPLVEAVIKNKRTYLLFPCWFPYDLHFIPLQILTLLFQGCAQLTFQFTIFSSMILSYIAYTHLKDETTILKYALKNISELAHEMARNQTSFEEENVESVDANIMSRCYVACTKACAIHHSEIIRYFNNSLFFMGIFFTTLFLGGIATVPFAGYILLRGTFSTQIKYAIFTSIEVGYLYVFFWIGDSTANEFQTVADVLYTTEWYNLPKSCHATLKLIQMNSNHPRSYKMILGQKVEMETYMALLKGGYYYMNMMLAK